MTILDNMVCSRPKLILMAAGLYSKCHHDIFCLKKKVVILYIFPHNYLQISSFNSTKYQQRQSLKLSTFSDLKVTVFVHKWKESPCYFKCLVFSKVFPWWKYWLTRKSWQLKYEVVKQLLVSQEIQLCILAVKLLEW